MNFKAQCATASDRIDDSLLGGRGAEEGCKNRMEILHTAYDRKEDAFHLYKVYRLW